MLVGKVIEYQEGGGGVGVEGDAVLAGGVQVFERVNRSFVVLLMGEVLLRC